MKLFSPPTIMKILAGSRGRGVFSETTYNPGDVIERCPIILTPRKEIRDGEVLDNYVFPWGKEQAAVVLGFGSLYNHSYHSNARYVRDWDEPAMCFVAVRPIQPGDEILINYNGDPDDPEPVWFDAR